MRNRRSFGFLLTLLLAMSLATSATAATPTPHQSFFELPMSNGFGVGHYAVNDKKLATFYPHIYKRYDAGQPEVPNWMYDAYFGIRGGSPTWFNDVDVDSAGYLPGTGIVKVVQHVEAGGTTLTATQYFFAPFSANFPVLVALVKLSNDTQTDSTGFASFALQNFHIGSGDQSLTGEQYERIPGKGYVEVGRGGLRMYYRSVTAPDGAQFGTGGSSPWQVMKDGGDFTDQSTGVQPAGDDLASGFQYNVPQGLAAGQSTWFGMVMAGTEDGDQAALQQRVDDWLAGRQPEAVLDDAKAEWANWMSQGQAQVPAGLSDDERAVWKQSLVVLRMAQSREPNGPDGSGDHPYGQLLAALPKAHPRPGEGIWNIAWVRDGAYAIAGLARAGFTKEARAGLEFMLNADVGDYEEYVGHPYAISITRYYGRGREETDTNQDGPNIEFDDFGLFLMALGEQLDGPNLADANWWKPYWPTIRDKVADTLVSLFEDDTWLIAPDSSIWERHWNGNQKHFTYTSAAAARGLCVAARLADEMGESDKADEYRGVVSKLRKGIAYNMLDGRGAIAGNLEELQAGHGYMDMAAVEALNFGLVDPAGQMGSDTLDVFRDTFYDGAPDGYGGYFRNDDGDWYDSQEWAFIDLRTATALGYAGRTDQRDKLLEWVVAQTRQNYGLMGELYCRGGTDCPTRGDYRGSVPMVGFGPGAFILAMTERQAGDHAPELCAPMADGLPPSAQQGGDAGQIDAGQSNAGDDAGGDAGSGSDAGADADVATSHKQSKASDGGCSAAGARGAATPGLAWMLAFAGLGLWVVRSRRREV